METKPTLAYKVQLNAKNMVYLRPYKVAIEPKLTVGLSTVVRKLRILITPSTGKEMAAIYHNIEVYL